MYRRALLGGVLATPAILSIPVRAQGTITLNGASQFGDEHPYTKALVRFEELVKQYYGKPVNFVLHKNSSLGLEKQYFEYMAQGRAVDYAVVSPAHMSTFSKAAPFVDAPFIFRDLAHWNAVLDQDMFKPVADEVERRAKVAMIGYGVIEAWLIGQLGPQALSAVSFTFPVTMVVISLGIGLGAGTSAVVARALGAGEADVPGLVADALLLTGGVAVAAAALGLALLGPLFRAMGAPDALLPLIAGYMQFWFPAAVLFLCSMVGLSAARAAGDWKTIFRQSKKIAAGLWMVTTVSIPIL